jgi:hypothetical protein
MKFKNGYLNYSASIIQIKVNHKINQIGPFEIICVSSRLFLSSYHLVFGAHRAIRFVKNNQKFQMKQKLL